MSAYKKLLKQNNIETGDTNEKKNITVDNVRIAMIADVATVYITDLNGDVYKSYLEADEALILIRKGDTLSVSFTQSDNDRIFILSSWSFVN